jgi:hypothetical protein
MSITITQEDVKFRPVTIVIDDEGTANLLRFILEQNIYDYSVDRIQGIVYKIELDSDAEVALQDMKKLTQYLVSICV